MERPGEGRADAGTAPAAHRTPVPRSAITGLLLAGGQGRRMGGADKGLVLLHGRPLADQVLARLRPQVGPLAISANRNAAVYRALPEAAGAAIWPDEPGTAGGGPLAALRVGLRCATTPWLFCAPCDLPGLPADAAARLVAAAEADGADIAVASSPDGMAGAVEQAWRHHPVVCVLRTDPAAGLAASLDAALAAGNRRVEAWMNGQRRVVVRFADAAAFRNLNTPDDLEAFALDARRGPMPLLGDLTSPEPRP